MYIIYQQSFGIGSFFTRQGGMHYNLTIPFDQKVVAVCFDGSGMIRLDADY
jgi:hypothetical protein